MGDGVLLQRFVSSLSSPTQLGIKNTILAQTDAAAEAHGRTYAIMWDMSNADSWEDHIKNDFQVYISKYTSQPRYLRENGKPVVCIFGIGLADRTALAPPDASLSLIHWLQGEGLYVIGSGPYYWRTGDHDAGSGYSDVHAAFDAIMPWSVGRYNSVTAFAGKKSRIEDDIAVTSGRGQDYAPIAFPGYSYRDTSKFNLIPRNGGKFFQAQIDTYLSVGASFYYIAMFDEIQEGTAIYKIAATEQESALPAGCFLTASSDGVTCSGDHYLTMAGQYAAAAHGSSPTPAPAIAQCQCQDGVNGKNYCTEWCNHSGKWGCGAATDGAYTCSCNGCSGCPGDAILSDDCFVSCAERRGCSQRTGRWLLFVSVISFLWTSKSSNPRLQCA